MLRRPSDVLLAAAAILCLLTPTSSVRSQGSGVVALLTRAKASSASEAALRQRVEKLGYAVQPQIVGEFAPDPQTTRLLLLGDSLRATDLGTDLKTLAVPILAGPIC